MNNITSSSAPNNNINPPFNCPNCWGFQHWNDQYQPSQIALISPLKASDKRDSFIRKFMIKYVTGVR